MEHMMVPRQHPLFGTTGPPPSQTGLPVEVDRSTLVGIAFDTYPITVPKVGPIRVGCNNLTSPGKAPPLVSEF